MVKFIFILLLIILSYTAREAKAMDLGELQVFLMVAKEGSFSRAAERLYRTQPAVSLTIRKLEDSLGQPLFVRGSRPVRLTDAGTLLKDYAERLINLRDEVKKGLSELEGLIPRRAFPWCQRKLHPRSPARPGHFPPAAFRRPGPRPSHVLARYPPRSS